MTDPLEVLIIEDSQDDAKLMELELRRHGFAPSVERVETAEAMNEALDRQCWDLVLADYNLPRFSAPQALKIVQARALDVPFILISGTIGEEKAIAAIKAGAHDFVLKQSLARLGTAVTRELRDAAGRRQRRRAEAALRLLANISRLLTDAADWHAVLRGAVQCTIPVLADWCILYSSGEDSIMDTIEVACGDCVDGEAVLRLAKHHRPSYPPDPSEQHPIAEALRERQGVLSRELTDEVLARIAQDESHRQLLQELAPRALIVLPLLVRNQLTGLWLLAVTEGRRYTDEDLALAEEVAGRIALVAANARLSRAREEFLSAAVHEIKTPVASMKMAVQLLTQLGGAESEAKRKEILTRLDRQTNRLTRLVGDVLDVSRVELDRITLSRRRTDLAELVAEIVEEMRDVSPRHRIALTHKDSATLEIDPDRIEQVLTNLIDNAIKYSPQGGSIEVACRSEGEELIVSIHDHGIGIPLHRQERIFERFYRAHAGTPYGHATSLGVGLHLSREFIIRHGGRIWFDSRQGEGSTFYFSLPLSPPSTQPAPDDPTPDDIAPAA